MRVLEEEIFRPRRMTNADGMGSRCRARTRVGKAGNVTELNILCGDNDRGEKNQSCSSPSPMEVFNGGAPTTAPTTSTPTLDLHPAFIPVHDVSQR
ncbi:hypothetical protein GBF38_023069 [Nibea albiflora]|uniref:Uncharacterized protein n=1 Tax=Nibea albiflora TaxID=240163 RepID=A0ACB7EYW9_NIBAL|nr:hypothetical protein GBF38_023069 [Nibea albiflora]